jgi:hypothetical protein
MPTPDDPDEFYLLLILVTALLPLQWVLGKRLHAKASAGTPFWQCFFAISKAEFHAIRDGESADFQETLKAYQRTYFYVMLPVCAVVFAVYFWVKYGRG